MSDFDEETAFELVETLKLTLGFQTLMRWLGRNNKCVTLFAYNRDSMEVWLTDVVLAGGGVLLQTRPGENSHYVREIELKRMLGIELLTTEELVSRAVKTESWPTAEDFYNHLRSLLHQPRIADLINPTT